MLQVVNVSGGYPGNRVLDNISFHVNKGEIFGILGPNGSGKTTLLKMISGLLAPETGDIIINGKSLATYSPKELAQMMAVLPQQTSSMFSYTVQETVALGRYPHGKGFFSFYRSSKDNEIIEEAMKSTGVFAFRHKRLDELSGGERQRVFLAQALAQEPEILLLDEPTNHLDLSYQKELLDQLSKWTRERDLTVISIFHDLNIASLYCDRMLLLHEGKMSAVGTVHEVLHEEQILTVYDTEISKFPHPEVSKPQLAILPQTMTKENHVEVNENCVKKDGHRIAIHMPQPVKVLAATNGYSGLSWKHKFQFVSKDETNTHLESEEVLTIPVQFPLELQYEQFDNLFLVVGKEATSAYHLLVFINGTLTDEGFIRAMITVGEAKMKVLQQYTQGSVVIASLQQQRKIHYQEIESILQTGIPKLLK